jgi:hypothetical protein
MAQRVLLLEVTDPPRTVRRLRACLPAITVSCSRIAVPLEHHTAEEVLGLCCSLELPVRGSRVVGSEDVRPSTIARLLLTAGS